MLYGAHPLALPLNIHDDSKVHWAVDVKCAIIILLNFIQFFIFNFVFAAHIHTAPVAQWG